MANSKNIQIKDLSVNLTRKVITIDFRNNNTANQENMTGTPTLSIKVPKTLLGTVTAGKANVWVESKKKI